MTKLITNNAEGVFAFTNHQIGILQQTEGINKNHLAKVLLGHIDTYKILVEHLIARNSK